MGKRERYEPGTFSWVDLATTDPEAAKAFYGELFGWVADDRPIPGGGIYSMMTLGGSEVAGIAEQQSQLREAGVPPVWNSYVTVASADEAADAAVQAGGSIHAPAFDVMTAGRMAVVADPAGAVFSVWEPRESIGAERVNDPGCLTANELSTNDVPAATTFYGELFGWSIEPVDTTGGPPYWMIGHSGAARGRNGGVRELSPEQVQAGVPPHWMPYFTAASVGAALETAAGAGGSVVFGPLDLPTGARIAVLYDAQGVFFGLFEGEVDD
jgi:predicted enzyme related to lactoylglutathione lyase